MSAWSDYKKKRSGDARPLDLLKKANYVEDSEADRRFDLCLSCPELIKMTKQCRKCGCFMALKTKLEGATCPIGKW